jgi:hypothetical protein
MWRDSPYAIPIGSFRVPVPVPGVDPDKNTDVKICVNSAWIPYIAGSLMQLLLQATWDTSDPDVLALAQQRATNLIFMFASALPCVEQDKFFEEFNDMVAFREDCDCNLFYKCCDGTEIEVARKSDVPASSQTNPGEPVPKPGETQSYCKTLNANSKILIPALMSTGDTITLISASGSTNDSAFTNWFCHDGNEFFGSGCAPGTGFTDGSDPMPGENHMSLIVNIGGTFYSLEHGTVTVPSGVTNAVVSIQVNDAVLSDDAGTLSVCVDVKNNAPTTWSHTWDFTLSPGAWTPEGGGGGTWIAGQGWDMTNVGGSSYNVDIVLPGSSGVTIDTFSLVADLADCDGTENLCILDNGRSGTIVCDANTNGHHVLTHGAHTVVTGLILFADSVVVTGAPHALLRVLVLTGTGTDPF